MATIVEHINCTQELHVMTLENPIEFLHRDKRSSITRCDIGTDTDSFVTGLKAALRQNPDVIFIGEIGGHGGDRHRAEGRGDRSSSDLYSSHSGGRPNNLQAGRGVRAFRAQDGLNSPLRDAHCGGIAEALATLGRPGSGRRL